MKRGRPRIIRKENELSPTAERLLSYIQKYQYIYNVTNKQYSYLLGISLRNTVKYINELIKKGRITSEGRRGGRGIANIYRVTEDFSSPEDN